jgi:hypothetical protein
MPSTSSLNAGYVRGGVCGMLQLVDRGPIMVISAFIAAPNQNSSEMQNFSPHHPEYPDPDGHQRRRLDVAASPGPAPGAERGRMDRAAAQRRHGGSCRHRASRTRRAAGPAAASAAARVSLGVLVAAASASHEALVDEMTQTRRERMSCARCVALEPLAYTNRLWLCIVSGTCRSLSHLLLPSTSPLDSYDAT